MSAARLFGAITMSSGCGGRCLAPGPELSTLSAHFDGKSVQGWIWRGAAAAAAAATAAAAAAAAALPAAPYYLLRHLLGPCILYSR